MSADAIMAKQLARVLADLQDDNNHKSYAGYIAWLGTVVRSPDKYEAAAREYDLAGLHDFTAWMSERFPSEAGRSCFDVAKEIIGRTAAGQRTAHASETLQLSAPAPDGSRYARYCWNTDGSCRGIEFAPDVQGPFTFIAFRPASAGEAR